MSRFRRFRDLDARCWHAATWSAPLVVQLVAGAEIGIVRLLGDNSSMVNMFVLFAVSVVIAAVVAATPVLVLSMSSSPVARGVALSTIGSFVVTAIAGLVYLGFWATQR
ncbi:MAG: hypothetical protein WA942_07110 [Mycolicibacter sinensis]